jgi:hypothetical protein
MSTTIKHIDARIGEDVYQPYSPSADVDVSDWDDWTLTAYIYEAGTLIATLTEAGDADGQIVREATDGEFYVWVKHAFLDSLSRGKKFLQVRRTDTGHNTVFHEGVFHLMPYRQT